MNGHQPPPLPSFYFAPLHSFTPLTFPPTLTGVLVNCADMALVCLFFSGVMDHFFRCTCVSLSTLHLLKVRGRLLTYSSEEVDHQLRLNFTLDRFTALAYCPANCTQGLQLRTHKLVLPLHQHNYFSHYSTALGTSSP